MCRAHASTQRAAGLKYGDPRAMGLLSALCVFGQVADGFANKDLRPLLAQLLGEDPAAYGPGRMSYDLRRLRLHGLIERKKASHRYTVTKSGLKISLLFTRIYARILRPACSCATSGQGEIASALNQIDTAVDRLYNHARLAA